MLATIKFPETLISSYVTFISLKLMIYNLLLSIQEEIPVRHTLYRPSEGCGGTPKRWNFVTNLAKIKVFNGIHVLKSNVKCVLLFQGFVAQFLPAESNRKGQM